MSDTAKRSFSGLRGAAAGMAAGTALSRLTGLFRILALAYALPLGMGGHLSDAYNLANNAPNMLYDIVLGGILSATFIPVFVDRLANRPDDEAWRAISSVVTVSVVGLIVATAIVWFLAPEVVSALTFLDHTHSSAGSYQLAQEREVTTSLLRWFVPQIALYGLIALATALLNTRNKFVAPMWVPIANNLVCIVVLMSFAGLVHDASLASVATHHWQIVLLGLGTTAGVVAQALLLIPSLRRTDFHGFRWNWSPRHEAVRTIMRLSSWTFGFVLASQICLFIILALAVKAGGDAPVSSYMYAYTFMQMPYAVVAVSIMSAVTPGLAERWSTGRVDAFKHRLTTGLRSTLAIILPASVGMLFLARSAITLLLAHGASSASGASGTGSALAMFAIGLPGFCAFIYVIRVLQSMQRARTAFWLYLFENGINLALAIALVGPLGVRGLALSLSIAYSAGAVAGIVVLRKWLGPLGDHQTWAPLRRAAIATVVMGAAVLVASNVTGSTTDGALLFRVVLGVVAGSIVFVAVTVALGALDANRRGAGPPGRSGPSFATGPGRPGPPRTDPPANGAVRRQPGNERLGADTIGKGALSAPTPSRSVTVLPAPTSAGPTPAAEPTDPGKGPPWPSA